MHRGTEEVVEGIEIYRTGKYIIFFLCPVKMDCIYEKRRKEEVRFTIYNHSYAGRVFTICPVTPVCFKSFLDRQPTEKGLLRNKPKKFTIYSFTIYYLSRMPFVYPFFFSREGKETFI